MPSTELTVLRKKTCAWCDQSLTQAARGHCGAIAERDACWWVPTIRVHGAREALRMSEEDR